MTAKKIPLWARPWLGDLGRTKPWHFSNYLQVVPRNSKNNKKKKNNNNNNDEEEEEDCQKDSIESTVLLWGEELTDKTEMHRRAHSGDTSRLI